MSIAVARGERRFEITIVQSVDLVWNRNGKNWEGDIYSLYFREHCTCKGLLSVLGVKDHNKIRYISPICECD